MIERNRLLQFETEKARSLQARTEGLGDSWLGQKKADTYGARRLKNGTWELSGFGLRSTNTYDAALGGHTRLQGPEEWGSGSMLRRRELGDSRLRQMELGDCRRD